MSQFAFTIEEAIEKLKEESKQPFTVLLHNGNMQIEYFKPEKVDTQTPHTQDEIYIITSGTSEFYRNDETINCKQGDIIFVPAKMEHRFVNFTSDFATWVIFYGDKKL